MPVSGYANPTPRPLGYDTLTSAVEVPNSPVDTELGALHNGLDEVRQMIVRLGSRLEPVSVPVPEANGPSTPPGTSSSRGKVCDGLSYANYKVNDLVVSLRVIIDRLTV